MRHEQYHMKIKQTPNRYIYTWYELKRRQNNGPKRTRRKNGQRQRPKIKDHWQQQQNETTTTVRHKTERGKKNTTRARRGRFDLRYVYTYLIIDTKRLLLNWRLHTCISVTNSRGRRWATINEDFIGATTAASLCIRGSPGKQKQKQNETKQEIRRSESRKESERGEHNI